MTLIKEELLNEKRWETALQITIHLAVWHPGPAKEQRN